MLKSSLWFMSYSSPLVNGAARQPALRTDRSSGSAIGLTRSTRYIVTANNSWLLAASAEGNEPASFQVAGVNQLIGIAARIQAQHTTGRLTSRLADRA
jgi:hypothetical protein